MKEVRVILSVDAEEAYRYLNEHAPESKIDRSILNSINTKVELIKANPHYGKPISKSLIPREYIENFGVKTCFELNWLVIGGCFTHLPMENQQWRSSPLC